MKPALLFVTIAEAATGLALVAVPSPLAQLLFGAPILDDPLTIVFARIAGLALLAVCAACWWNSPHLGMLVYGAGITLVLFAVALTGNSVGMLLWPVGTLHAGVAVLLFVTYR